MIGPGALLGQRYRLKERIASGGMGDVWRCVDEVLDRVVAVKILLPTLLDEPGFTERFRAEARTMAAIKHAGVVDVYDYGSDPAVGAYLVMEFVEGDALSRTLAKFGRLTAARTMDLIAQAAEALQAAHEMGVVHRDVKPGNLLVRSNGTLVLTDFGIARSIGSAQLTAAGAVLGTASYISPEQALGNQATNLSDVYALGVVAYQCLSGRRPFEGDNPYEIAMRHVREAPPPLPPDVPPTVQAIVERAMAKEPGARWQSATALAQAARRAVNELAGVGPRGTSSPVAVSVSGRAPARRAGTGGVQAPVPPVAGPVRVGAGLTRGAAAEMSAQKIAAGEARSNIGVIIAVLAALLLAGICVFAAIKFWQRDQVGATGGALHPVTIGQAQLVVSAAAGGGPTEPEQAHLPAGKAIQR